MLLSASAVLTPMPEARASGVPASGPVSYAAAVERAAPAVVSVIAGRTLGQPAAPRHGDPGLQRFQGRRPGMRSRQQREEQRGSGVILDANGYIVTSSHVVQGAHHIEVVLHTGERLPASIAGSDPDSDVAVLRVDLEERRVKSGPLAEILLGSSSDLRVGDVVLAIGNPYGVGQTVTMGIVSATGRSRLGMSRLENYIQTDASINPGNSGGALIDAQGRLIGVNAAIFSSGGGAAHGIGFAIPVDMVRGIIRQLLENGVVSRGWLGVGGQNITAALADSYALKSDVKGVLITQVYSAGAAGEAGLRPGDVITSIDGRAINSSFDIVNRVSSKAAGSEVFIQGWRGSAPLEISVRLQQRREPGAAGGK